MQPFQKHKNCDIKCFEFQNHQKSVLWLCFAVAKRRNPENATISTVNFSNTSPLTPHPIVKVIWHCFDMAKWSECKFTSSYTLIFLRFRHPKSITYGTILRWLTAAVRKIKRFWDRLLYVFDHSRNMSFGAILRSLNERSYIKNTLTSKEKGSFETFLRLLNAAIQEIHRFQTTNNCIFETPKNRSLDTVSWMLNAAILKTYQLELYFFKVFEPLRKCRILLC